MSPFEHGEVYVLDDGGEVRNHVLSLCLTSYDLSILNTFKFFILLFLWVFQFFCFSVGLLNSFDAFQLHFLSKLILPSSRYRYCLWARNLYISIVCEILLLLGRRWVSLENDLSSFLKVDLDLGNYERFLDLKLTRDNNITTGKIYQASVLTDFCMLFKLVINLAK